MPWTELTHSNGEKENTSLYFNEYVILAWSRDFFWKKKVHAIFVNIAKLTQRHKSTEKFPIKFNYMVLWVASKTRGVQKLPKRKWTFTVRARSWTFGFLLPSRFLIPLTTSLACLINQPNKELQFQKPNGLSKITRINLKGKCCLFSHQIFFDAELVVTGSNETGYKPQVELILTTIEQAT